MIPGIRTVPVSGRIGTKRYLTNAGGAASSGCLAHTFSSDARTRSWSRHGKIFGTGLTKMV
jgi:hypothetical protein